MATEGSRRVTFSRAKRPDGPSLTEAARGSALYRRRLLHGKYKSFDSTSRPSLKPDKAVASGRHNLGRRAVSLHNIHSTGLSVDGTLHWDLDSPSEGSSSRSLEAELRRAAKRLSSNEQVYADLPGAVQHDGSSALSEESQFRASISPHDVSDRPFKGSALQAHAEGPCPYMSAPLSVQYETLPPSISPRTRQYLQGQNELPEQDALEQIIDGLRFEQKQSPRTITKEQATSIMRQQLQSWLRWMDSKAMPKETADSTVKYRVQDRVEQANGESSNSPTQRAKAPAADSLQPPHMPTSRRLSVDSQFESLLSGTLSQISNDEIQASPSASPETDSSHSPGNEFLPSIFQMITSSRNTTAAPNVANTLLTLDQVSSDNELDGMICLVSDTATEQKQVGSIVRLALGQILVSKSETYEANPPEGLNAAAGINFFTHFQDYNEYLRSQHDLEVTLTRPNETASLVDRINATEHELSSLRLTLATRDAKIKEQDALFESYRSTVIAANQRLSYITAACGALGYSIPDIPHPDKELETSFDRAEAEMRLDYMNKSLDAFSQMLRMAEADKEALIANNEEKKQELQQRLEAQTARAMDTAQVQALQAARASELAGLNKEIDLLRSEAVHAKMRAAQAIDELSAHRSKPSSPPASPGAAQFLRKRLDQARDLIRRKDSELSRLREELALQEEAGSQAKDQGLRALDKAIDIEHRATKLVQDHVVRTARSEPSDRAASLPLLPHPDQPRKAVRDHGTRPPSLLTLQTRVLAACNISAILLRSDPHRALAAAVDAEYHARRARFAPLLGLCNYWQGHAFLRLGEWPEHALVQFRAARRRGAPARYHLSLQKLEQCIQACEEQIAREDGMMPGEMDAEDWEIMVSAEGPGPGSEEPVESGFGERSDDGRDYLDEVLMSERSKILERVKRREEGVDLGETY